MHIHYCYSFFDKLKGLMFSRPNYDHVLVFPNEKAIHTFFMRYPIAVIVCDKDQRVIDALIMQPWRIGKWYQRAALIIESANLKICTKAIVGKKFLVEELA